MIHFTSTTDSQPLRQAIAQAYLSDETSSVQSLMELATLTPDQALAIGDIARHLITKTRERAKATGGIEALLREYDLSSQEGVALMCLAEALLRIPDARTADRLIKDKLNNADWEKHLGQSHSLFVNASTWGLMLTGKLIAFEQPAMSNVLNRLLARGSEPVIRLAIQEAMGIIGKQFVLGETIENAIKRSQDTANRDNLFSFDMLGEAALTKEDAQHYLQRYFHAIDALSQSTRGSNNPMSAPGISIKLSALHPRFEFAQRERVIKELTPDVLTIAQRARDAGITITIDAEEADRLDVTLDVLAAVYTDSSLADWEGLGLAVQAYQKRALPVIRWLQSLAKENKRRIMVRLVKGAYWDTEIKRAQEQGLEGYPVFSRKVLTDLSYQACVKQILAADDCFYPQFATHNAYTIALVQALITPGQDFEFQRLHGMGQAVYSEVKQTDSSIKCRVYAPVGNHADLLPYLVRRLLENGANTSFVNRIENDKLPVDDLIRDPVTSVQSLHSIPNPAIPLPRHMFGEARANSKGLNFYDTMTLDALDRLFSEMAKQQWQATPLIDGKPGGNTSRPVVSVENPSEVVGHVVESTQEDVTRALNTAFDYQHQWAQQSVDMRANTADRAADLLEAHLEELTYLCVKEGGRCIKDAAAEVREAIDGCRYYAQQARQTLSTLELPGPTGEANILSFHGRGTMVCISPWNFPVAIFTGQVIAALIAGNTVVAKPAHQTPLTAMRVVQLLHEAGIPPQALSLLPGKSSVVSAPLLQDERIAGMIFTGSTNVARTINQTLAMRTGPIATLIAETGGQNAMIVDSSALPEQVVSDVITSAFNSAGQRCSALRVLFLQEDIASRVIDLLSGAIDQLTIGDPLSISTDVGPLIDQDRKEDITRHINQLHNNAKFVCQAALDKDLLNGNYMAPTVFEIDSLDMLKEEVFGPVLHIIRYKAGELDRVIDAINATQFGLTLGIHSRIEEKANYIAKRARVGNIYVNRNMIGAVIGVQPFGGEGLSGTGPKAGGPNYLRRLVAEQTVSINTSAIGGNAALLNLEGD
jgi:RHH-type proline utilization regulon transcriptional repressor/proline dehydrogenase/delta 1-pyrroline-5-carboxylate dehydrogenase